LEFTVANNGAAVPLLAALSPRDIVEGINRVEELGLIFSTDWKWLGEVWWSGTAKPDISGELRWSAMVAAGRRGERSRVPSLSFGWERFRPSDLGSTVEIRTYLFDDSFANKPL
jgi:hypothetical protein